MILPATFLFIVLLVHPIFCLKASSTWTRYQRFTARSTSPDNDINQPPIIPFDQGADFVRPPVPTKRIVQIESNETKTDTVDSAESEKIVPLGEGGDPERANGVAGFLRDVYIGAGTDSTEKKQARFIVRSITVISVAIGIVFTSIWYLFPGQFISYRGVTQDAVERVQPENVEDNPQF
jgi:hypothetical protein